MGPNSVCALTPLWRCKSHLFQLYRRYRELAEETQGVWLVGRLATYRDYNMDRVVAQALTTYRQITGAKAVCPNARQPELGGA